MYDADLGEEEVNFYLGYISGIKYYKICHENGYEIEREDSYYCDFGDYHFSQGYDNPLDYVSRVYSIFKPFMDIDGTADKTDELSDTDLDWFISLGLPDLRGITVEGGYVSSAGYYIHIQNNIVKRFHELNLVIDDSMKEMIKNTDFDCVFDVTTEDGEIVDIPNVMIKIDGKDLVIFMVDCSFGGSELQIGYTLIELLNLMKEKIKEVEESVQSDTSC